MASIEGLNAVNNAINQDNKQIAERSDYEARKIAAQEAAELYKAGDARGALSAMAKVDPSFAESIAPHYLQNDPTVQGQVANTKEDGQLGAQTKYESNPHQLGEQRGEYALKEAQMRSTNGQEAKHEIRNDNWATNVWKNVTISKPFKEYQDFKSKQGQLLNAATNPSAFGDIASVFSFMKTLDPTSVVRESEYSTAAQAGSLLTRAQNAVTKAESGKILSPEQRADLVKISNHLGSLYLKNYDDYLKPVIKQAEKRGVPIDSIDPYSVDESGNPRVRGQAPQAAPQIPHVKEVGQALNPGTKVRQKSTGKILTVQPDGSLK